MDNPFLRIGAYAVCFLIAALMLIAFAAAVMAEAGAL